MNLKAFNLALMTTLLLGTALVAEPASAANGVPGRVIHDRDDPVGPSTGTWRGSYYTQYTVWGDGIEHIGEVGTTFRTGHEVFGNSYQSCHSALIAEMNAVGGVAGWTDCSPM
ncbi:hypothetical protein LVB77_17940 [Lysobacter sp. 5GHs7-4]|uniref:hypothetical protein n=1 Tax=Lysobacter sp. 5GHs7-4 TaxID=2904253 RepID=UPI001E3539A0|nr:hypothetical protein [Lysobacter sp. 5GHs7-4]UHQ22514.1 hypothetical protein LVB77_17940 [Lysobacter sp. 5GHs7-4]